MMPTKENLAGPFKAVKVDPVFLLFLKNIERIRVYYHAEKFAGEKLGYNTMMEIMAGHISAAGDMAMRGKEWEPS